MATPKKNLRGLQDIRTLSGKGGPARNPYMAYMRISCLEMEKQRRGQERESALHRVKSIDERLQEIEAEKAGILQALNEQQGDNPSYALSSPCSVNPQQAARAQATQRSGFKLRY